MDKIKKVYVDPRYKTNGRVSNSQFKFELNGLDLADNAVCYIDDISIPHTWYTIENYTNKLYIESTYPYFSLSASVLSVPEGNYNATILASTLQSVLQASFPNENYNCVCNSARGSITISSDRGFIILADNQVIEMSNTLSNQPGWFDKNNQLTTVDVTNLVSMMRYLDIQGQELQKPHLKLVFLIY